MTRTTILGDHVLQGRLLTTRRWSRRYQRLERDLSISSVPRAQIVAGTPLPYVAPSYWNRSQHRTEFLTRSPHDPRNCEPDVLQ